ncbi:cation:proton antiporter [Paraburkholderia kururiensis]|uniref:Cation:proton antiporter n=1 Tax=Paraburkholderia kururiensis TaxID=984307 RepID=A0ABZ0WN84_9BURK|nr:cation:proton antiporter [Paraburkholderia kururiensis]WQD78827.1 cation:proton antiporter [Paraburkholderia kururiensis]
MHETLWFLIVGGVLVFMGIAASTLKRLPVSAAMVYLLIGFLLGPPGINLLQLDLVRDAHTLRVLTEIALLVSLFAIGLRLRVPFKSRMWLLPLRLGLLAMIVTVPLLAWFGVQVLNLAWGPALLLGAMLAPTDPVLAHDVQVHNPGDLDRVRFSLSGEGGVNDGIALPFALAGLALCESGGGQAHALPSWPWLFGEALWGVAGAVVIGGALAWATMQTVAWLRTRYARALGLEGFFALGLIELAYGAAQLAHTYGFIAVFAAGVTMRRVEHRASGERPPREVIGSVDSDDVDATASDPQKAHAYMAESVLGFTIEMERIAEVFVMTVVGNVVANLREPLFTWSCLGVVAALFFVVRPLAVTLSLAGAGATPAQRRLMGWFGIRGVGSFYYLAYSLEQGPVKSIVPLVPFVIATIVASVIVHGISATPLMNWYRRVRHASR